MTRHTKIAGPLVVLLALRGLSDTDHVDGEEEQR